MTLYAVLIALMLQAAPAAPQAGPKASVAGVVVNANGEPIPNIRVSLGRTDVSLGPFAQMVAGERPPREMRMPAELLAMISEEIAAEMAGGAVPPEAAASAAAFKALPVADIHELVVSPNGSMVVIPKSSPPTITDERGRFAFNDVTPGTYKLMFSGGGYAKQDYGQRSGAGGVPMTLTGGQAKTDIVMRLNPVSAVSGRVRDAAGQPVAGVPVQLFRFAYNETGKRTVDRVTSVRTDDRGEYRMYYLTPGRYYMSAGNQPGQEQAGFGVGLEALLMGGGYSTSNRISQNYAVMYYPGAADESSAAPIDVPPGADLRGIDLLLSPQQSYRVRGRVVDSRTGQPPPTISLSINVQNADPLTGGFFNAGNSNYKAIDGSFEFQNISAGSYSLNASIPNPPQPQQRPPDFANMSPVEQQAYFESQRAVDLARPKASAAFKVVNADVDGVNLTLGVASSLSGRFRVESNAPGAEALQFMRIQLGGGATFATDPLNGGPQPRPVGADGAFRIDNVWPGEYRVFVNGLPPGFYVKEARLGDADLLNGPLRLTGPESRPLDVLISPNVGTIQGAAVDAAGQPAPGAQVVLIPARNRERTELFRPVTADSTGRFAIPAIAPGEYILAAWDAIEPNAFFDPGLIRQAEEQGKVVRVAESSSQTVNLVPLTAK
jgi:5-hydroxyisourate hydrolase-like protein (transthyretin family)